MAEHDQLTERLRESLKHHARTHAPQADLTTSSVRHARTLRARRRAAIVAAVLVVGVGVPTTLALVGGDDNRAGEVASSPSATPSAEPTPVHHSLPADALPTADDIDPIGTYSGFRRVDSASMTQDRLAIQCLPRLATVGAEAMQATLFVSDSEATATAHALQFATADEAEQLVAGLQTLPDQCGDVGETRRQVVHQPQPVAVAGADEALVWAVETEPLPSDPGSETSWDGVAVARADNVVVVFTAAAFGDPTEGAWPDDASGTLGLALERAGVS